MNEQYKAAIESAQKMCDHWEAKAGYWKLRAEEAEAIAGERDRFKAKLIKIQEETK